MKDKLKIITIGIEEVPEDFVGRSWLKMKPSKILLSPRFEDGLDIYTIEDTDIRMEYPLEQFAVGKNMRSFYIREKDKKAFVELLNGWIDKEVEDRIQQYKSNLRAKKEKGVVEVLRLLFD